MSCLTSHFLPLCLHHTVTDFLMAATLTGGHIPFNTTEPSTLNEQKKRAASGVVLTWMDKPCLVTLSPGDCSLCLENTFFICPDSCWPYSQIRWTDWSAWNVSTCFILKEYFYPKKKHEAWIRGGKYYFNEFIRFINMYLRVWVSPWQNMTGYIDVTFCAHHAYLACLTSSALKQGETGRIKHVLFSLFCFFTWDFLLLPIKRI